MRAAIVFVLVLFFAAQTADARVPLRREPPRIVQLFQKLLSLFEFEKPAKPARQAPKKLILL